MSGKGAQFLHLACQGGRLAPNPRQLRHYSWGVSIAKWSIGYIV